MKKILLLASMLTSALSALAGIEVSQTLPKDGTPEHSYTMANAQGYYCNVTTSPTRNSENYAKFAFYKSNQADSYYIYNITARKWVSYTTKSGYTNQVGFVSMTDEKQESAIYKITEVEGYKGYYQFQPYNTTGVAAKYLNWFEGVGSSNPENGNVTLGIYQNNGKLVVCKV